MAEIKPFKALLYNKEITGDLSDVMAPPYDVISDDLRDRLYGKSDHNIVRLILGRSFIGDDGRNNKYTRARKNLEEWLEEGALVRDRDDSFYVYQQEYEIGGKTCRRTGFLALMKIEGDDVVLPHEHTLSNPKEDRMNLIKEVEGNLSPIFTLYNDEEGRIKETLDRTVSSGEAIVDISIDGVTHKLWRLSEKNSASDITSAMENKKVFIADGHHRYEVARAYRDMRRKDEGYDGSADHVLMYFTDISSPDNLTVLGTHRALKNLSGLDLSDVRSRLEEHFSITPLETIEELTLAMSERSGRGYIYGFITGEDLLLLEPKNEDQLRAMIKANKCDEWKSLDVSVLHSAILGSILDIKLGEGDITYVKDAESALDLVTGGSHAAAFLLNPTKVSQLKAVAEKGEMMPQKSTYFYPKLLTGLVINRFAQAGMPCAGKKEEG
jgi:uncharacterized protein (DUF1015 family)